MLKNEYKNKMIELSKNYCIQSHRGVYRNDGSHYYEHPIRVGDMVSDYTADEDVIISAYLHDVLEHGDGTESEIKNLFNERVLDIVKELTNDLELIKIKGKKDYLIHKINNMSNESLLIKLCDRYDNLVDDGHKLTYFMETSSIIQNINRPLNEEHNKVIYLIKSIMEN